MGGTVVGVAGVGVLSNTSNEGTDDHHQHNNTNNSALLSTGVMTATMFRRTNPGNHINNNNGNDNNNNNMMFVDSQGSKAEINVIESGKARNGRDDGIISG